MTLSVFLPAATHSSQHSLRFHPAKLSPVLICHSSCTATQGTWHSPSIAHALPQCSSTVPPIPPDTEGRLTLDPVQRHYSPNPTRPRRCVHPTRGTPLEHLVLLAKEVCISGLQRTETIRDRACQATTPIALCRQQTETPLQPSRDGSFRTVRDSCFT